MFTSIAIIGRPNVGKSSLFNKLTRSRDAIVSDFPGLTKDRNYGYFESKNKKTLLIDTGGISESNEDLKDVISAQAWIAVQESSLVIFLIDGSEELTKVDQDIFENLRKFDKEFLTVLNKIDKKTQTSVKEDIYKNGIKDFFEISAEHSINLSNLKSFLEKKIPERIDDLTDDKKVAILGRPNAGKSTFINQLVNQDRLIVSEIAGTTIDAISIPFEINNEKFTFIDTAGIRKGYKYNHRIEYFSFIRALHSIEKSDIVIFLCDASENLVDQDLKILNMIIDAGKPILFAMNKIDLLSNKELVNLRNSKKMQSEFMQKIKKVEISALNKKGFKRIFKETNKIIQKSQENFSTSLLNKLLDKFIKLSAPPSVGGRLLKFKHIHFSGVCPTTFVINANQDKKIPDNYKKYLENSFRKELSLESIQLKLIFKKSINPYQDKKNQLNNRQEKKRKRLIKHKKKSKK
tara:strand:+ start:2380 stop:3765 length:1386 start_codon:yes stop_codon:yes gene_type:complete